MYPRANYEMTQAQLDRLLDACKPTPVMLIGGYGGSSPQQNANDAWAALGREMGFDSETVRPIDGKAQCHFSAVPSETLEQRQEREAREKEEARQGEITKLRAEISEREVRLSALTAREKE